MTDKRIAVIADVHGNRWALESVLEDIRIRGVGSVLNLGDSLYGPLDPAGTFDILNEISTLSVMGNEDRIIVSPPIDYPNAGTLKFTREALHPAAMKWLEGMRQVETFEGEIVMFHGTARSDEQYLLRKAVTGGTVERSDLEVSELAGDGDERLVLCAHDHTAAVRQLDDGRLVVDPGSVGLQAYRDDAPVEHAVGHGDPRASYAIIEKVVDEWSVSQLKIEYDNERAAEAASRNGRDDWSAWLLEGTA